MEYLRSLKRKVLSQKLSGTYRSSLTIYPIFLFIALGVANIAIGIGLYVTYSNIFSISIPYQTGFNSLNFVLNKPYSNIFIYLQLDDFYSTHLAYSKSYSNSQLEGEPTTKIGSCTPLERSDGKIIYPCGLIANNFNQDSYRLFRNNNEISIDTENITWESAKQKIKNTRYTIDQIVAPPLWNAYETVPMLANNNRFAEWMSQTSFPHFRKMIGVARNLEAGNYRLDVNSNFQYGKKSVALSSGSWGGDKNYFLSWLMIVSGVLLISLSILLWYKQSSVL